MSAVPTLVVDRLVLADLELVLDGVLPTGRDLGGPVATPPSAGAGALTGVRVDPALAATALEAGALLLVDEEQTPLARLTGIAPPSGTAPEGRLAGHLGRERRRESGAGRRQALDLAVRPAPGTALVVLARPPLVGDLDRVLALLGPAGTASTAGASGTAGAPGTAGTAGTVEAGAPPEVLLVVPDHRHDTDGVPTHVLLALAAAFARRLEGRRPGLVATVATAPLAWRDRDSDPALVAALADHLGVATTLLLSADAALDPAADDWADGRRALVTGGASDVLDPDDLPVLGRWRRPRSRSGLVVFFTGFSGSGKSTIARALHEHLLEQGERTVTLLDGDVVRQMLSSGLGFDRAGRTLNIRRIGFVAAEIARHGGIAICAPVAPYDEGRKEARAMAQEVGDFLLVHVSTPLEECERRDLKGLYARARAGTVPEFTGISDPYDVPDDADLTIDTAHTSTAEAVALVADLLAGGGWTKENA